MATRPELPESADAVIIGGGIMGTSVAYSLTANADLDIVVVEKDNIATGSTGDSSANIRFNYGDHEVYTRLAWWSHEVFQTFEDRTGQPLPYVPCPRVRFGTEGTEEAAFIRRGHEIMADLGIPTREIPGDELGAMFPMFKDLDRFDFAITEDAASYSDGTDAANGFARAAMENGATIVTGVMAHDFDVEDGTISAVRTSEGTVTCDAAVVCAGPWTPRLGERLDLSIPITPTREEVLILDPPARYAKRYLAKTPMIRFPGGEWYMRPDFGGGILVATHPFPDRPVDPDAYRTKPDEKTILRVLDIVSEYVEGLETAQVRGGYCGLYSTTPDHDYIIDEVGADGCYFVCGFSGHGFKHSPAIGKIVSDLVLRGDTDLVDLDMFSLGRFDESTEGHGQPVEPL